MEEKLVIIPDNSVCCDRILVKVEGGALRDVVFEGGCDGNGKALGRLLQGMPVARAVEMLNGVDCEGKGTSCADQLARGLKEKLNVGSGMDA